MVLISLVVREILRELVRQLVQLYSGGEEEQQEVCHPVTKRNINSCINRLLHAQPSNSAVNLERDWLAKL